MQNKSVFLALNDGITASDIRKVLMGAGVFKLKVFSTCENMLKEVINVSPPDLIIADTDVSDRSKLISSIYQIRSKFHVPIIFLSRNNSKLSGLSMPEDPGCEYIAKPLSDNKLLQSLEKFLKNSTASSKTLS